MATKKNKSSSDFSQKKPSWFQKIKNAVNKLIKRLTKFWNKLFKKSGLEALGLESKEGQPISPSEDLNPINIGPVPDSPQGKPQEKPVEREPIEKPKKIKDNALEKLEEKFKKKLKMHDKTIVLSAVGNQYEIAFTRRAKAEEFLDLPKVRACIKGTKEIQKEGLVSCVLFNADEFSKLCQQYQITPPPQSPKPSRAKR